MLQGGPRPRGKRTTERVPDSELGLAAVLIGIVVLVTTFLVPVFG